MATKIIVVVEPDSLEVKETKRGQHERIASKKPGTVIVEVEKSVADMFDVDIFASAVNGNGEGEGEGQKERIECSVVNVRDKECLERACEKIASVPEDVDNGSMFLFVCIADIVDKKVYAKVKKIASGKRNVLVVSRFYGEDGSGSKKSKKEKERKKKGKGERVAPWAWKSGVSNDFTMFARSFLDVFRVNGEYTTYKNILKELTELRREKMLGQHSWSRYDWEKEISVGKIDEALQLTHDTYVHMLSGEKSMSNPSLYVVRLYSTFFARIGNVSAFD